MVIILFFFYFFHFRRVDFLSILVLSQHLPFTPCTFPCLFLFVPDFKLIVLLDLNIMFLTNFFFFSFLSLSFHYNSFHNTFQA